MLSRLIMLPAKGLGMALVQHQRLSQPLCRLPINRVRQLGDFRGHSEKTRIAGRSRDWRAQNASSSSPLLGGNDGGGDGAAGNGGSGGSGGGDGGGAGGSGGEKGPNPEVTALLLAAGRAASSFPADIASAIQSGKMTAELLQRYLSLESSWLTRGLMGFGGFRERLMADPGFMTKVAIEVGIGICTKMSAEYAKRQGTFEKELDFVAANVMMALIADFMLVWLPAPTLSFAGKAATGTGLASIWGRMFAGCPDNAFQKVQPGMPPFTFAQRLGAPIRNGLKLFCVGVTASFFGVAVTNALITLRGALDPSFVPLNQPQDVLATSAAYGTYMATSSNLRYQLLAGVVEERGIETMFKGNYQVCGVLSLVVRTLNTFLGSLLWVDFIRLLGMQKAGGGH